MPKTVGCNDGCLIRGLAVGLVRRYALMGWLTPLLKCAEDETGPPWHSLDEDRIRRVRFPQGWHG